MASLGYYAVGRRGELLRGSKNHPRDAESQRPEGYV